MFSAKFNFSGLWISLMCLTQLAGGAWLRCYKGSLEDYVATPLHKPLSEPFTSCLQPHLPTIAYTFGYRGKTSGPATKAVLNAYLIKKKANVLLLDWEEEARSGILGIPLGYAFSAVPKAKKIGNAMGRALINLHKAGVNMTQMHLLGHSLGAHLMAFAGRRTREVGLVVARITGLDPARALFEGTLGVQDGLDRTCAKFVDILHSDPGGYGTSSSFGTVDIWPNYGSTGSVQPGCPTGNFDMFSPEDLCSHDRSWRYYVEAIGAPTAFPAAAAADYDTWVSNGGLTNQTIYLGDLTSTRARGNFYLTTNAKATFAKGFEGLKPDQSQVREKRKSTLTKLLTYLR